MTKIFHFFGRTGVRNSLLLVLAMALVWPTPATGTSLSLRVGLDDVANYTRTNAKQLSINDFETTTTMDYVTNLWAALSAENEHRSDHSREYWDPLRWRVASQRDNSNVVLNKKNGAEVHTNISLEEDMSREEGVFGNYYGGYSGLMPVGTISFVNTGITGGSDQGMQIGRTDTVTPQQVPEPSSLLQLVCVGLLCLGLRKRFGLL